MQQISRNTFKVGKSVEENKERNFETGEEHAHSITTGGLEKIMDGKMNNIPQFFLGE